jgi:hypothetical protein
LFDEASKLKEKGFSNTYIATRLNKTRNFVDRLLRKGGAGLKDRLKAVTKEKLEELYIKDKLTMEQISEKLNISVWYIRNKFREFKISARVSNNPAGNKGVHYFTQNRNEDKSKQQTLSQAGS